MLIDVAAVHTSAASHRKKSLTWFRRERAASRLARKQGTCNAFARLPSPIVADMADQKRVKYRPLLNLAFAEVGRRRFPGGKRPTFLAPILSHHGELSGDFFTLIDSLGRIAEESATAAPEREDGITPRQIGRAFRSRFRDHIAACLVSGMGSILATAGAPLPVA